MNKYSSYKDSEIKWLDQIPSSWERSRIRMVGNLYGGLTGKKGDDFNREENKSNKPFVPFTNISKNTYISKDHFQYVNVEEGENQNRVLKNDLFFLMSSESYEDLGKSSILLEDVEELYLNSFCKGYRVKDNRVYPLFLNYQLLGSLHKEMISIEGNK
jgi:type I restriction enzyme S subunit